MATNTNELQITAITRSLIDIDMKMMDADELFAYGNLDEAVLLYKEALSSLKDRFKGDVKNIPEEALKRRFKILNNLTRTHTEKGDLDKALKRAKEAIALSADAPIGLSHLAIHAYVLAGLVHLKKNDKFAAKEIITEASKLPKGPKPDVARAISALGTGSLMLSFDKPDLAIKAFESGVIAIAAPAGRDQVMLKVELYSALGHAHASLNNASSSAGAINSTIFLLIENAEKALFDIDTHNAIIFLSACRKIFSAIPASGENMIPRSETNVQLAGMLRLRGRLTEVDTLYRETLALLTRHEMEDLTQYVVCLAEIGNLHSMKKEYAEALKFLEKAVETAEKIEDIPALVMSMYYMGLTISKQGSDEKGIATFEEAIDIALEEMQDGIEKDTLLSMLNNQLGFINLKMRQFDSAQTKFKSSIQFLRHTPQHVVLSETYRLLGEAYTERQQHMQAERALKAALDIAEKSGSVFDSARAFKSLGACFLNGGDLDKASFYLDESIKTFERLGLESELPMIYSYKARICVMKEEYETAESFYMKDYKIAKRSGNPQLLAHAHFQIALIRRIMERVLLAEEALNKSLSFFSGISNNRMLGAIWSEFALCAVQRKEEKKAVDSIEKAKEYINEKNLLELASFHVVRGIVNREFNRLQVARKAFEDAVKAFEKNDKVISEWAEAHYEFAMYLCNTNSIKEASEHFTAAIELAEKLGLMKKIDRYLSALNKIDPGAGAKVRMSRFVDKATVEQISKSGVDNLTVERKKLTILFTDIRGFTTISETLSLEELTSFLNDFYSSVTRVVQKFQGRINKFVGDQALAIFNMDGNLEDHEVWAVRAALDFVSTIEDINKMRQKKNKIRIDIGIGINSGEVLLGSFGSGLRQDYTAIGDNVNIAARLQALAGPRETIVSQYTYDRIKEIVTVEDMGEKPLKGKGQHIHLWKVTGLKE